MRAAGLRTAPYRVAGRNPAAVAGPGHGTAGAADAPGDWGFVLAARSSGALRPPASGPRPLTRAVLAADARAAERDRPQRPPPPSTLVHPRYAD